MTDRARLRIAAGIVAVALFGAADAAASAWLGTAFGLRPVLLLALAAGLARTRWIGTAASGTAALLLGALVQLLLGDGASAMVRAAAVGTVVFGISAVAARIARLGVRRLVLALLAITALLLPFGDWVRHERTRLSVAVVSSLPIGIGGGPDSVRAVPLRESLQSAFDVRLLDAVPAGGPGADRLLLAQPRALSPGELVAIDAWVRRGGVAVVLDDPTLDWPSVRSLGDPSGPQRTSLLDPLLEHWGLRLELAEPGREGPRTLAWRGGPLRLPSPGFFSATTSDCVLGSQALTARCGVGRGTVLAVADADWIDPGRWTASDPRPFQLRSLLADGAFPEPRSALLWMLAAALLLIAILTGLIGGLGNRNNTL